MLLVIFWTAGLWYEENLVREAVFDEFGSIIGQQSADELMNILRKISETKPTPITYSSSDGKESDLEPSISFRTDFFWSFVVEMSAEDCAENATV